MASVRLPTPVALARTVDTLRRLGVREPGLGAEVGRLATAVEGQSATN